MKLFLTGSGKTLKLFLIFSVIMFSGCSNNESENLYQIALLQFSPIHVLENGAAGIVDGLKESGYFNGQNIKIKRFNALGDLSLLNSMSSEIVSGKFKIGITISTPAMLSLATANKSGKLIHIFGLVTDPFNSGMNLDTNNPGSRPSHLFGYGTFEPVEETFKLLKRINPVLKKIGIIYNSAEPNSVLCVKKAVETATALGIKIESISIENSNQILEAASALIHRGIDAFWTAGDNLIDSGFIAFAAFVKKNKIPVITSNSEHIDMGSLISYGADYYQTGKLIGKLTSDIIKGKDMSNFKISNIAPVKLCVNKTLSLEFDQHWQTASNEAAREAEIIK